MPFVFLDEINPPLEVDRIITSCDSFQGSQILVWGKWTISILYSLRIPKGRDNLSPPDQISLSSDAKATAEFGQKMATLLRNASGQMA